MTSRTIAALVIAAFVLFLGGLFLLTNGPERTDEISDELSDD